METLEWTYEVAPAGEGAAGLADTAVAPLAIATGIASAFALLVLVLMATAGAGTWQWLLLAVAMLVALGAGVLTYRAWRRPYARV